MEFTEHSSPFLLDRRDDSSRQVCTYTNDRFHLQIGEKWSGLTRGLFYKKNCMKIKSTPSARFRNAFSGRYVVILHYSEGSDVEVGSGSRMCRIASDVAALEASFFNATVVDS